MMLSEKMQLWNLPFHRFHCFDKYCIYIEVMSQKQRFMSSFEGNVSMNVTQTDVQMWRQTQQKDNKKCIENSVKQVLKYKNCNNKNFRSPYQA
jgi:hypothetical protein